MFIQRTEFAFRVWKKRIVSWEKILFFPLGYLLKVGTEGKEDERGQEWIKQSQISIPSNNKITLQIESSSLQNSFSFLF